MIDKKSKIYIAGHTGMAGSAIHRKLVSQGYNNIVVRTHAELDLTDQHLVAEFFKKEKPDVVVLAAARVGGIKANMDFQVEFLYENTAIELNVIMSAFKNNTKKLLFLSSTCVYPRTCPQPMSESDLLTGAFEPTNEGYAVAKVAGMKLCQKIRKQYGNTFFSCIPTNLYGFNDSYDPESSHVFAGLLKKFYEAKTNNFPNVSAWGSGSAVREFLFSEDLADACVFLLTLDNPPDFVNMGGFEHVSIKELTELVKKVVGYEGEVVWDTSKPDGAPIKTTNSSIINGLGWKNSTTLEEGTKKTYDWFTNNLEKVYKNVYKM